VASGVENWKLAMQMVNGCISVRVRTFMEHNHQGQGRVSVKEGASKM
jgi:hypothetical protein